MIFRYSVILSFFALVFGCQKDKGFESVEIIGHAATGLKIQNSIYHDNSKEGIEFALSIDGCNGVEIDVQLSKDNELWLFHDVDLSVETNSQGCISNLEEKTLSTCIYSSPKKEKLAKLKDIDFSKVRDKIILLDLRHANICENKVNDLSEFLSAINKIKELKKENVYVLLSINEWVLPFSNQGYKTIVSLNSFDEINFEYLNESYGVILKNKGISKEQVDVLHEKNKKVYIFDIRAPKETRKALEKHPDGVVTDDIRTALIEKY